MDQVIFDKLHSEVVLENTKLSTIRVSSDVPQGIVLGPTLFLIFINDLPDYISHSALRMFADDCLLYKTIRSPQDVIDLQQDLFAICKHGKILG